MSTKSKSAPKKKTVRRSSSVPLIVALAALVHANFGKKEFKFGDLAKPFNELKRDPAVREKLGITGPVRGDPASLRNTLQRHTYANGYREGRPVLFRTNGKRGANSRWRVDPKFDLKVVTDYYQSEQAAN